ncbi:MAG: DUF255 domain-containing protein [Phycisphaerae bacterium]|nr:DUF255 domain-containing protein [Phycisphaerae bacterium]MDD5380286.1 DUF255 domain-containing protein [Phycisphaerae bacterium]
MAQTQAGNHDDSTGLTPNQSSSPVGQKHSRSLWIIILVFAIFVVAVFLTENKGDPTSWWEKDYHTGIKLAKQQNKPALICFFRQGTRFSSDMWQGVYNKPDVQKYVVANFIPILIDVDKQPELAKRYNVTYYPTHYVENPNTNQTDGPFIGAHRLVEFIKRPRNFTSQNSSLQ